MDISHRHRRSVRLVAALFGVLSVLVLSETGFGQTRSGEDYSHRILPPDAARLSQLQAQAALLYRLQQFSGQQQIPGVSDPDRQKRLQQIMQQMAMKLGQSSLQRGGRNPRGSRPRPGSRPRNPGSFPSTQPGTVPGGTPRDLRSFLEQISGRSLDDLPAFTEPPGTTPGAPGAMRSGSRTGYTRNPNIPLEQQNRLSQPDDQRLPGSSPFDDASDSSLTLTERLTRIADRARVNSLGGASGSGGGNRGSGGGSSWLSNAGLQSALTRALEGAANSLAERATLSQETERGRDAPQPGHQDSESAGPGAAQWISDLASRATAASESAHESMAASTAGSGGSGGSMLSGTDLLLPLLLMAGAGCAAWWLQRRRPESETDLAILTAARMPKAIQSREDIVTAFHVIAARAPEVAAIWWTHRRAALALSEANPKSQADVETLSNLYELARYLPRDQAMTAEQMAAASHAVQRIRRS